jgi:SAM-dependent methyltransferase
MPFGYSPQKGMKRNLLLRLLGWPNWMRRLQGPKMLEYLALDQHDRVLDLGCGSGPFTFECARQGCLTVGLDVSAVPNALAVMNQNDRIHYVLADGSRLPFKERVFTKIILSSVIQMVWQPGSLLAEVSRVLHDSGRYVFSTPTDHVIIPRLYDKLGTGLLALGFPPSPEEMVHRLAKSFGAIGRGLFGESEARSLAIENGLDFEFVSWVPGKVSCSIYETILIISWRFGLPLSSSLHFPLLYPIGWIEGRMGSKRGNELLVGGKTAKGTHPSARA